MINLSAPIAPGKNRGFTLMEMTITMVILSVMVIFTLTFIYQAVQIYMAVNERTRGYEEVQFAMERMVREIREASNITYPAPGTANASQVTVNIKRPSGIIETVDFRLSDGNIIRNDNQHPVAGHVSNFNVERTVNDDPRYGPNKLTLWITFTANDGQTITTCMHIVPKNISGAASYPKKRFHRDNGGYGDWWEVVKR
jgi:prepilin-type N-terminal cleavage/methylation domain-containing protein